MDGRIGRLNCRCTVLGAPQSAGALRARLEKLAREQFAAEFATAMETALGDDPSVYVLRRVSSRMTLVLDPATPDQAAARRWGERAVQAAVRVIARDAEGENLVRFEHQADFVAHFITDLIGGQAQERWFYGAFRQLQPLPQREALVRVLEDNLAHLPAVLGCLQRGGGIEALLDALDAEGRRWLWLQARGEGWLEQAGARSLVNASLQLFDRLGLWQGARPDAEQLLGEVMAAGPAPVDWRDEQGLAEGMLAVARVLRRGGHLRAAGITGEEDELAGRLREALAALSFGWLDGQRYAAGLLALLAPAGEGGSGAAGDALDGTPRFDLPLRRGPAPAGARVSLTPRMRRLLETLRELVEERQVRLAGAADAERTALRLYGALTARDEGWEGDALALETIQRLAEGWRWLRQQGVDAAGRLLDRLARGEPVPNGGAGQVVPGGVANLGEPGADVLRAMLGEAERARLPGRPGEETVIETGCAGAALLLRALIDVRIAWLYGIAGFPADQPGLDGLVLALALAWAGPGSLTTGAEIDPGLQFLAGLARWPAALEPSPLRTLADLRERWRNAPTFQEWQALWLRVLAGQHLLLPEALLIYRMASAGQTVLVAGDASGSLWPLGGPVETEREGAELAASWLAPWLQANGAPPDIIAGAGTLAARSVNGLPVLLPEEAPEGLAETYQAGGERLLSALGGLEARGLLAGALGQPGWDLTLALTANGLLRLWARWLRGFGQSSVPYLLGQFIHRPGRLVISGERVTVEMEPRPLDIVLHLSGYLDPLKAPWLGDRTLHFEIRGAE